MYSVITFNGNDKKFDLGKHKILAKDLSQDEAIKIRDRFTEDLEFEVIKSIIEIADHNKDCKCGRYDSFQNRIGKIQNSKFYCHQTGKPVYVLMLKMLNQSNCGLESQKGLRVLENEDFVIADYCFSIEELDILCQRYQNLVDQGKVLLKVMTRRHPLNWTEIK